jgi:hypothetical protein
MTNDYILQAHILQDLKVRNFTNYEIKDELLVSPSSIPVSNNQIVYLAYFQTRQPGNFKTSFTSGVNQTTYHQDNTPVAIHVENGGLYYASSIVSRHDTNVEVKHEGAPKFYVRMIQLTLFNKNEKG